MNIKTMINKAKHQGDWDFANSILYKLCSENPAHERWLRENFPIIYCKPAIADKKKDIAPISSS